MELVTALILLGLFVAWLTRKALLKTASSSAALLDEKVKTALVSERLERGDLYKEHKVSQATLTELKKLDALMGLE